MTSLWRAAFLAERYGRMTMTLEEVAAAANSVKWSQQYHVDYARAVERAHGIGGD